MADENELITSLRSAAARRGRSFYLDLPPAEVTWAFEAGLPDPVTFPLDDLERITARVLREDAEEGLQYGSGYSLSRFFCHHTSGLPSGPIAGFGSTIFE